MPDFVYNFEAGKRKQKHQKFSLKAKQYQGHKSQIDI